ncbi:MAG: peptidase S10, partial [Phycisphaerae bacterium]|nr:peptidase S10 [Phycisphaerae bacterium]
MSIQLLIVCLLSFNPLPLEEEPPQVVIRPEPVVTEHVIQLDGRDIEYTATAGTLPLYDEDGGRVEAQVFHIAYMKKGADPSKRPIFFLFNGGPGSSSVWLHLGAFGPKRVLTGDTGDLAKPPWRLAENDA